MDDLGDSFGGGELTQVAQAELDRRYSWVLPNLADTTKQRVLETVQSGLDEGQNPRRVAQRLRGEVEGMKDFRSENIARSEMLNASNAGTHAAHRTSDAVDFRAWLHVRDIGNPELRDSHLQADRDTRDNPVRVRESFVIDGISVRHPGDFGVPSHDCMCRCTVIPKFPNSNRAAPPRDVRKSRWEKQLTKREERTLETARNIFDRLETKLLSRFAQEFNIDLEQAA